MTTDLIIVTEYCDNCNIEQQFIALLENEGLIEITILDGTEYLHISQLLDLERYARWYYDLSINIAGIDTIQRLLRKVETMQADLQTMQRLIDSYNRKEDF